MASLDPDFIKYLNLIKDSPLFVIRIDPDTGQGIVSNPAKISDNTGHHLVHGITKLACGHEVASVFEVNTGTGGTLVATYWHSPKGWITSDDPQAATTLGLGQDVLFPFDWAYSVPLETDIYHD